MAEHKTYELQLIEVDDSVGTVFPEELVAQLSLKEGDTLYLTETKDGFRLTLHQVEAQEQAAFDIMERRQSVLKRLAD